MENENTIKQLEAAHEEAIARIGRDHQGTLQTGSWMSLPKVLKQNLPINPVPSQQDHRLGLEVAKGMDTAQAPGSEWVCPLDKMAAEETCIFSTCGETEETQSAILE